MASEWARLHRPTADLPAKAADDATTASFHNIMPFICLQKERLVVGGYEDGGERP